MRHKFKVGDKVKIIGNCNYHSFKLGEVVTLTSHNRSYDTFVGDYNSGTGNLQVRDIEPYNINSIRFKKKRGVTCDGGVV